MLQDVNLNEIRQYNNSLKQYKSKAATLTAEIEYTNKELESLCAELTTELGVQVTPENIEQIYNEQVAKINSTLQSGNAVLAKIASEEQAMQAQPQAQAQVQAQPQMVAQPQMAVQPQQTATQASNPFMQAATPVVHQPQVQGSVFNGQSAPLTGQQTNGELPPMFSI